MFSEPRQLVDNRRALRPYHVGIRPVVDIRYSRVRSSFPLEQLQIAKLTFT